MENSWSIFDRNCENSLKQRNLLFSMDHDSGYISHNPESNLDSSVDNNENSASALNNGPIFLNEDALLETPEVNKYPNMNIEIEREDFEETRHIFNSPILSNSTTEISGSTESREISYSGFDTEESSVSVEIPYCKQLIFDNKCVQNNRSLYSSPDLNDIKRDASMDFHNSKNSVFTNITNTFLSSDPKKKLTLVFSKDGKENIYSVKRKYQSITPDKNANEGNASFLPTPRKLETSKMESSLDESVNESLSLISNFELSESTANESLNTTCKSNGGMENSNFEQVTNIIPKNENTNEQSSVSLESHIKTVSASIESKNDESVSMEVTDTLLRNGSLDKKMDYSILEQNRTKNGVCKYKQEATGTFLEDESLNTSESHGNTPNSNCEESGNISLRSENVCINNSVFTEGHIKNVSSLGSKNDETSSMEDADKMLRDGSSHIKINHSILEETGVSKCKLEAISTCLENRSLNTSENIENTANSNFEESGNMISENENVCINEQSSISEETNTRELSLSLNKNDKDSNDTSLRNKNMYIKMDSSVLEENGGSKCEEKDTKPSLKNESLYIKVNRSIFEENKAKDYRNINCSNLKDSAVFEENENKNLVQIDETNLLSSGELCTNDNASPHEKSNFKNESCVFEEGFSLLSDTDEVFKGFENAEEHKSASLNKLSLKNCGSLILETSSISDSSFVKVNDSINQSIDVTEDNSTLSDESIKITENSINLITSVVTETLQEVLINQVLKGFGNSEIKDIVYKKVNEALETSRMETPNSSSKSECESQIKDKTNSPTIDKYSTLVASSVASTPEKLYKNPNNSGLSPDMFTDDVIEEKPKKVIQPSTSTPKERNMVKKDYMIWRRAQNNLKGVLPPRSLTMFQISVPEILNRLENNTKYFWNNSADVKSGETNNTLDSLLITCPLETCKTKGFPEVLKDRGLGLYHNRSKFSEEFEELCVKYGQRYVGAETQSSCTVFETQSVSPMKRRNMKPQWNLKSPGKRLSHLARRRITFSSANLQLGNSFLDGSRTRQIVIDAKKRNKDLLVRIRSPRKSPRKTPKKTPGKSPRTKTRTPSSSAKKKLAMRFRKVTGEIEKSTTITAADSSSLSAKRMLFHSSEEEKQSSRLLPSTSGTSSLNSDIKRSATKRALFPSPSKSSPLKNMGFKRCSPSKRLDFGSEKKRKRTTDSVEEPPSKFARCHSENIPSSSQPDARTLIARTRSDLSILQNRQIKELTTNHKKKLQLAIYEALRSQNILPTHPQFKVFASNLGRLTRKLFLVTTAAADCIGVTEKMLRIARYHVIAVVKGKSPEEIYEEFVKNRLKNSKPQGYIAPGDTAEEKKETERRALGLKNNFSSDNKIDRIRKAINFGDDDNR